MGVNDQLEKLLELIKDVSFFKDFTHEEKLALTSSGCEVVRYLPHEEIIIEGETDRALYILLRGEVGVTKNDRSHEPGKKSKKAIVARLSAGSVFGEIALIGNRPRTSGAQVIGEAIVLKMNGDRLAKLDPLLKSKFQAGLIGLLIQRLDDMNNQMTDMAQWQKI